MSYDAKKIKILDLTTFSGSIDPLRTAIGGFWTYFSESVGSGYEFKVAEADDNAFSNELFKNVYTNQSLQTTASSTILPTYVVPIRIVGNSEEDGFESYFKDSKHWETYLIGGTLETASFSGVFSNRLYDSYQMYLNLPYSKREANLLQFANSSVSDIVDISYEYNHAYRDYERYIATRPELLIPNIYQIATAYNAAASTVDLEELENGMFMPEDIKNFISIDGALTDEEVTNLLDTTYRPWTMPPPSSAEIIDRDMFNVGWNDTNLNLRTYLTGTIIFNSISGSTETPILTRAQNFYFDEEFYNELQQKVEDTKHKFPFYVKISFSDRLAIGGALHTDAPGYPGNTFRLREYIESADYSAKFIKALHSTFGYPNSMKYLPLNAAESYSFGFQHYSASIAGALSDIQNTRDLPLRSKDLFKFLIAAYRNPSADLVNGSFVGRSNVSRKAAMDHLGKYTIVNTIKSLDVMDNYAQFLSSSVEDSTWGTLQDMYNFAAFGTDYDVSEYTTPAPPDPPFYSPPEVVAFRIEKRKNNIVLQNFWIYNSSLGLSQEMLGLAKDRSGFNFYDSQVKYGEEYEYIIYAYVVSAGVRYNYSDHKIAHVIASASVNDTNVYCLKFTDATAGYNGDASDQLYYLPEESSAIYTPEASELYEAAAAFPTIGVDITDVEFLTGSAAYLISTEPYIADFNLKYEISPRIFQLPIATQKVTIQDHPASPLDSVPFQVLNNSQQIGFSFSKDAPSAISSDYAPLYPTPLSATDKEIKNIYLNSNNLIDGLSTVTAPAVSPLSDIEVYRIMKKPEALSDFDGSLYSTLPLKIPDSEHYLSTYNFYDTVNSNTKYYYLFRGVNDYREPGYSSDIYEVELVNDGGYKYAIFNVLYENELEIDTFTLTSEPLKKLLQINPSAQHLTLNSTDSDFAETAHSQLENVTIGSAEDTVWGKTFKFRLTSKKTGKKIDLNITYKLETEE